MLSRPAPVNIPSEFERCWPWIAAAMERFGHTHEKEQLLELIQKNAAQLHPYPHSGLMTYIHNHPSGLRDGILWLAGGNLNELVRAKPLVEQWFKSEGCNRSCINGRRGWSKVFPDYKELGIALVKDLK
jgi:hypothetical protein